MRDYDSPNHPNPAPPVPAVHAVFSNVQTFIRDSRKYIQALFARVSKWPTEADSRSARKSFAGSNPSPRMSFLTHFIRSKIHAQSSSHLRCLSNPACLFSLISFVRKSMLNLRVTCGASRTSHVFSHIFHAILLSAKRKKRIGRFREYGRAYLSVLRHDPYPHTLSASLRD